MKVALLTDGIYPFVMGGMQKHSYYFAKYLSQQGVQVQLFHFIPENQNPDILTNFFSTSDLANIEFIVERFPSYLAFPGHYLLESFIYSKRIFDSLIRKSNVDLIYSQGFTGWQLLRMKNRGIASPPVWVNLHGLEMFQYTKSFTAKLRQYLLKPIAKYLITNADYSVSLGGRLTKILSDRVPLSKIIHLPIGIDKIWLTDREPVNSEIRKLCFIGRYEERKGIEDLNSVVKQLITSYPFSFEFVGYIPEQLKIIDPKIIYRDQVNDEDRIKEILTTADALVVPSHSEGMPTVILEAMACGCAIIATDVGAVNCLVSNENGWLMDPFDKMALFNAITALINLPDQDLLLKKKHSIQTITSSYTWESIIESSIHEMEKTLLKKKRN